jgi:mannose-6-phosphate isomerase-like protein (cupin superfamily)
MTDMLRMTPAQALSKLPDAGERFATLFDKPNLAVEVYAPIGHDAQRPHDRDELYIVISGTGSLSRGDETVAFAPGDLLFVPAHVEHRFEQFSEGFATWVIFFGSRIGGAR